MKKNIIENKKDLFEYVINSENGFNVDNYKQDIDNIGVRTYLTFEKDSIKILFEIETNFPYSLPDLKLLVGSNLIQINRFLVYSE